MKVKKCFVFFLYFHILLNFLQLACTNTILKKNHKHEFNQYEDYIWTIIDEFNLENPFIVTNSMLDNNINFIKRFFSNGQFTNIYFNINDIQLKEQINQNIIVFLSDTQNVFDDIQSLLAHQIIFLLPEKQFHDLFDSISLQINHKIYFFKISTWEMYEKYVINDIHIKKKLGHIVDSPHSKKFVWNNDLNQDFIIRRSNFHGLTMKAIVEFRGTEMNANSKYKEHAPYYESNDTYLINGYSYGIFNDVLQELQYQLNFTTLLYKHRKVTWGDMYKQPNGSLRGTGMLGLVFYGKADLIVAPLGTIHILHHHFFKI